MSVVQGSFSQAKIPTCGEFAGWELGRHPAMSSGWIVRPALFGSRVTVLPEHEGGHVVIKSERVARLIAAAPDLLEVLPDLLADSIRHYGNPTDETCGVGLIHAKARAAIAKATEGST